MNDCIANFIDFWEVSHRDLNRKPGVHGNRNQEERIGGTCTRPMASFRQAELVLADESPRHFEECREGRGFSPVMENG